MRRDSIFALCALHGALLFTLQTAAPAAAQTTKNLVANGSFDTSLSGWTVIGGAIAPVSWRPTDATGGPGSGTARVVLSAGHIDGAVVLRQCVTVNGAARYAASLRTRSSSPRPSQLVLFLTAWGGAHCDGSFLTGGQTGSFGSLTARWETQHVLITPPAEAHSYLIDLDVQGGPGGAANTVEYDDVFLGPIPASPIVCLDGPTTLCLDDAPGDRKFLVEARFAEHDPPTDDAHAVDLSSVGVGKGGLFWFFSADNPEVLVKVLNACGVNHRKWIFASAGTNVAADVFVLETTNGAVSWLHNPSGRPFPTVQDVSALGCPP